MARRLARRTLPVALLLLSSACASAGAVAGGGVGGTPAGVAPGTGGSATPPSASATLTDTEIEAIYRARIEASRSRFVEADVTFMTGMIHHHAQAVEMARLAPRNGASEEVRTLAARILNSQQDEIALMQRWLEDRGQPVPVLHITDEGVMVHGGAVHGGATHGGAPHAGAAGAGAARPGAASGEPSAGSHAGMPGMLTPEQLASLAAARGTAFDRLFLTLMIEHHLGAVTMVHDLFATDGAAQDDAVFRLASDVQVDQLTEVARMERMLERLPSGEGAP